MALVRLKRPSGLGPPSPPPSAPVEAMELLDSFGAGGLEPGQPSECASQGTQ